MKTKARQDYLADAEKGLALVEVKVQKSLFNRLEGVDTLDLGLDVLARALAGLFDYPDIPGDEAPRIDEVLAYLVARGHGHASRESVRHARAVLDGIKSSTYRDGLGNEEIKELEEEQSALYRHLRDLVRSADDASGVSSDV